MSRGIGRNENKIVRFQGRYYVVSSANAYTTYIQLSPLVMDSRILAISDGWQEFRFNRVKAHAWLGNVVAASPSVTPGGANLALAYTPALPSSGPAGVTEAMSLQNAAVGNGTFGAGYPHLELGPKDVLAAGPVKWYRRGTAYDDTLEVQGIVYAASTDTFAARPITILLEYEVEFRTPADLALTSSAAAANPEPTPEEMARQIADLQRVLGMQNRVVKRLPSLLPDGETKDVDSYIQVDEPPVLAGTHSSQVAPQGQPVRTGSCAPSRQDASGPNRQPVGNQPPLSVRSRPF